MASKVKKQPEKRDDSNMTEIMHRFKSRPFLYIGTIIILVMIVIVFLAPSGPGFQSTDEITFGSYNGVPIKYVPNNYFHQAQQRYAQQFPVSGDDPNFLSTVYRIWSMAFEETVVTMGILDEMKQAGFTAPEDVIDKEVAALPMFHENGRFSSARYRAMDSNTLNNLLRQVRDNIALRYYMTDITNMKTSSGEASFAASMSSPRRSFDLVSFPLSSYPDSEVISYAAANPALFAQVHLSRITINSSEREARQILSAVRDGVTSFEEAARNNSQDHYAERGGDMGIRTAYELREEISDERDREIITGLSQGSLSEIVRIPDGWAFFRANQAARPIDLDDQVQIDGVRSYIVDNMRGRIEDWLLEEAEIFAGQAETLGFELAAAIARLNRQTFGPIPVNFGNTALFTSIASSGVPELAGAGYNLFFWNLAFSTPLRSVSIPRVIGDNVIVLYPLEETHAAEFETGLIESYYPDWINRGLDFTYRIHFFTNGKLSNNFDNTFFGLWEMQ